jgi:tRNA(Ile)-lysidine synthase
MRPLVAAGPITIVRPFLDVARARLRATATAAGLEPVEDAMNTDPRFARARVRRIMPLLAADGFDAALIAGAARRLADAAAAIDAAASELIARAVESDAFAVARLDPSRFAAAPDEVRLRTLTRLLMAIGGEDYPPRHERLRNLASAMVAREGGRFKRTLAGAVIEWRAGRFVLFREFGRLGLPTVAVKAGFTGVWDHRFRVAVDRGAPAGLTLGPLGEEGRRLVGAYAGEAPAGALAALPALSKRRTILAVPALGYVGRGGEGLPVTVQALVGERLAQPPLFPDFAASL